MSVTHVVALLESTAVNYGLSDVPFLKQEVDVFSLALFCFWLLREQVEFVGKINTQGKFWSLKPAANK